MIGERFDYEIRQADKGDIPMIMEYIEEDWRKGHILATKQRFQPLIIKKMRQKFIIRRP